MKHRMTSDFLVPMSSLLTGAATIFNLGGGFFEYNDSDNSEEADLTALASDWMMIGQDFRDALDAPVERSTPLKAKAS